MLMCKYTTDALTFSLYPPLQALPQNHSPKNSGECARFAYPGNRLRADIFSIHLLTACTFGPIKNAHVFVEKRQVCLCLQSTLCDIVRL